MTPQTNQITIPEKTTRRPWLFLLLLATLWLCNCRLMTSATPVSDPAVRNEREERKLLPQTQTKTPRPTRTPTPTPDALAGMERVELKQFYLNGILIGMLYDPAIWTAEDTGYGGEELIHNSIADCKIVPNGGKGVPFHWYKTQRNQTLGELTYMVDVWSLKESDLACGVIYDYDGVRLEVLLPGTMLFVNASGPVDEQLFTQTARCLADVEQVLIQSDETIQHDLDAYR